VTDSRRLLVQAGPAAAYVVLAAAGVLTITDGFPLGLVWAGAGVAELWLLAQDRRRGWVLALAAIAVIQALSLAVAGEPGMVVLGLTAAAVVQAFTVAWLFRRFCPDVLGGGGEGSIHDLRILLRCVLTALVGTAVAALPAMLSTAADSVRLEDVAIWWGGASVGLLMTGAVGHLGWEYLRTRDTLRPPRSGWVELAALWVFTAAVLLRLGLSEQGSSYLVLAPAVWVALRCTTVYAATHASLMGLAGTWITVHGSGPFAQITDPHAAAATFQSFLLLLLLTTLTIAVSRDQRIQAMAGVFASAELFDAMTEAMTEGIVVMASDGTVQRLNTAASRLVGALDRDDAPGSLRARSVAGEPLSVEQHPARQAIARREVVRQEVILTLADGRERIVVVTASPLTAASRPGSPRAVVVYRDVPEERRPAEILAAMDETTPESLLVVDAEGRFLEQNGSSRRLLGQSVAAGSENIYDYPLRRLDGTPLPPEEHPSVRARAERRPVTQDVVLPLANGQQRILSITAAPLTGGFAFDVDPGVLKVYRDVTDERRQSRQLAEFAATVAHDLRSPLTATLGWLDLADELQDERDALLNALRRARGGVDRMAVLIEELLNQATADGGELRPEPVDLGGPDGLLADLADLVDPSQEADIAADDVPGVLADPEMLTQLMANLLGNSLKYVEPGTTPRVRLTGAARGSRVQLDLVDNGIGIPEDQRDLVFERFHRAHPQDGRYTGTGLGLAICRTIVERHGGRIVALPGPGGVGTTFRFDLPAAEAD
jgi:PAS domain S-box-containing protein